MEEGSPEWKDTLEYTTVTKDFELNEHGVVKFIADEGNRFKSLQDVTFESAMPKQGFQSIVMGKHKTHWKNVMMLKDAQTLVIYQQLFYELKPGTIFDIGTFTGGSALWAYDITRSLGLDTKIVSIDISHDCLSPIATAQTDIKFIQGSVTEREKNFPEDELRKYPKPWIVLEDCHIETDKLWQYFDSFMSVGDYFIVEDLHKWQNYNYPGREYEYVTYEEHGSSKDEYLKEFLDENSHWKIDSYYSDFYGSYATLNGYGYCRKMSDKV